MIEAQHVHYDAGGVHILKDVSAAFRQHKFNVILGPNGAGKSTLLKICAGLLAPAAGEVRYDGRSVTDLRPEALAKQRAVLSQRVDLAFPLAVEDVVLMGRYPHYGRVPAARDREIVNGALAIVEMDGRRTQSYPTLSGGEQQKVQLARVLAQIWDTGEEGGEKYLFLDEPTSNLDVHYQLHLLNAARAILDARCTVVAILHDLNVAFDYGDAFFVIEDGRIAFEADRAGDVPGELIERVFNVKARRVNAASDDAGYWRFSL
jgi:iron complex transport system ATP-binding protein